MKPLGETRRHYWLAQKMASFHGLDLAQASARGDLDQTVWSGMVQRCRSCDWAGGCARYLARGEAGDSLPEGCVNRVGFATLQAVEELDQSS